MSKDLFTIGHSSHPISRFVELLSKRGVSAVCDVRSTPYSRRNPQFNRESLASELERIGIRYVFLGKELGARSEDPNCYVDGQARYDRIAETDLFKKGIDRVMKGVDSFRLALMCAESDPLSCHRTILVCRHLRKPGLSISHILGNGEIEPHEAAETRLLRMTKLAQGNLFENSEDLIEEAYDLQASRIAYRKPLDAGAPYREGAD